MNTMPHHTIRELPSRRTPGSMEALTAQRDGLKAELEILERRYKDLYNDKQSHEAKIRRFVLMADEDKFRSEEECRRLRERIQELQVENQQADKEAMRMLTELKELRGQLDYLKVERANLLKMVEARDEALRIEGVTFESLSKMKELQAQVNALTISKEEQKAQISKLESGNDAWQQHFDSSERKWKQESIELSRELHDSNRKLNELQITLKKQAQEGDERTHRHTEERKDMCAKHENEIKNWVQHIHRLELDHHKAVSELQLAHVNATEEATALRLRLISGLKLQADVRDRQKREADADKIRLLAEVRELEALQKPQDHGSKLTSTEQSDAVPSTNSSQEREAAKHNALRTNNEKPALKLVPKIIKR